MGVLPLAPSFDVVGWLTRDVADSRAVARVLLPRPSDPATSVQATRVVRLPDVEALADPAVQVLLGRFLAGVTEAGLLPPAEEVSLPREKVDEWFAAFRTVQGYEAWQAHGAWITAHPGALGDDVAQRFAAAAAVTEEQAAQGRATAARARAELTGWLDGAVLVMPTAPGPAPLRTADPAEIDDVRGRTLRMSCLAPLAGAPAVSLPLVGRTAPVGLCLIGAPGTDAALLGLAARLEGAAKP